MAAVRMYIDKFGGEVLINEDHPLAVAQREKQREEKAEKASSGESPPTHDEPTEKSPAAPRRRKKGAS